MALPLMRGRLSKNKLRRCYNEVWATDSGRIVLLDLMRFTMASTDLFHPESERITCRNLGSRRVGLRIESFLRLSGTDVTRLVMPDPTEEGDE